MGKSQRIVPSTAKRTFLEKFRMLSSPSPHQHKGGEGVRARFHGTRERVAKEGVASSSVTYDDRTESYA